MLRNEHDEAGSSMVTIFPARGRFTDTLIAENSATLRRGTCAPAPFTGFPLNLT